MKNKEEPVPEIYTGSKIITLRGKEVILDNDLQIAIVLKLKDLMNK